MSDNFSDSEEIVSQANVHSMIRVLCKQKKGLNVCHFNAQSLAGKMTEFKYIFENSDLDIICISETWFQPNISDSFVNAHGFKVLRSDRLRPDSLRPNRLTRGGGVALYIRKNLSCAIKHKSNSSSLLEYLLVEVYINTRKILVGVVYRPDNATSASEFLEILENVSPSYNDIILGGDLNSNLLIDNTLIDNFSSIGLFSVNRTIPTHFSRSTSTLIDLFLVSDLSKVLLYDQLSVPCFSRHDLIFMTYDLDICRKRKYFEFYDLKNIDYTLLHIELIKIDWCSLVWVIKNHHDIQIV